MIGMQEGGDGEESRARRGVTDEGRRGGMDGGMDGGGGGAGLVRKRGMKQTIWNMILKRASVLPQHLI